jgi:NADH dehydrogenase/NADH:ubiquinone oxidoreductase subunit G
MMIFTDSKRIKKMRESIVEFLLANHPLDCPICDQGGECDLQDLTLLYGKERTRHYNYNKRSVVDINFASPFIKTIMDRCIHCTRCVRFVKEISGNFGLGVIGRGVHMQIGTYIKRNIDDFLISNVIDLCPVGALCAKSSSYSDRS